MLYQSEVRYSFFVSILYSNIVSLFQNKRVKPLTEDLFGNIQLCIQRAQFLSQWCIEDKDCGYNAYCFNKKCHCTFGMIINENNYMDCEQFTIVNMMASVINLMQIRYVFQITTNIYLHVNA